MSLDDPHACIIDIRLATLDCAEDYEGWVVALTPLFNLR